MSFFSSLLVTSIGEAKNLPSQRDVYASVKLDQEEIYRTAVKEKTQRYTTDTIFFLFIFIIKG